MLVIICTTYGKNPSRTVDATEWTQFSRPRPNDLENIGQGQRSLHATHPLILVIICAKYGKNPLRTVDFFFQGQGRKFSKNLPKTQIIRILKNKANLRDLIAATGLVILLKLDLNRQFFSPCDLEFLMDDPKQGKSEGFESCDWPIVRKRPVWVKIGDVLYRVTSKFDG